MKTEIERKFLPKELPSLEQLQKLPEERFYLLSEPGTELRVQRKGDKYSIVKKYLLSEFERKNESKKISPEEYSRLKSKADNIINRTNYSYLTNPKIDIKVYSERFEGLVRIEVEFDNIEQMKSYKVPDWFGAEITGTKLARDSELLSLSAVELKRLIGK